MIDVATKNNEDVCVLVVDDDPAIKIALKRTLAPLNVKILEASSGKCAVKQAASQQVALVLLDINMPGIDGFETADLLRKKSNTIDTPIIFITANNNMKETLKGYEYGAVDYLLKPLSHKILFSKAKIFIELFKKNRQLELQRAQLKILKDLKRSNRLLEQFAYVVSHDLKAPLRHIGSFSVLLEEAIASGNLEDASKELEMLKKSAARLGDFVDGLIDLSRVSSRRKKIASVSLSEVLKEVLIEMKPELDNKNIKVTSDPLPTIQGDEVLLTQLFLNLIENACKYSQSQNAKIQVLSSSCDEDKVVVTVKDNGIGFDSTHAEVIFEPFKRLVSKSAYPGSGIGLVVCKTIVEHHGGSIWATSKQGLGSEFTFSLLKKNRVEG